VIENLYLEAVRANERSRVYRMILFWVAFFIVFVICLYVFGAAYVNVAGPA